MSKISAFEFQIIQLLYRVTDPRHMTQTANCDLVEDTDFVYTSHVEIDFTVLPTYKQLRMGLKGEAPEEK